MIDQPDTIETLWEAHNALTMAFHFLPTTTPLGQTDYRAAIAGTMETILAHINQIERSAAQ